MAIEEKIKAAEEKIKKNTLMIEKINSEIEETKKEHSATNEQLAKKLKELEEAQTEDKNKKIKIELGDANQTLSEEQKFDDNEQVIKNLKKRITDLESQLTEMPKTIDNPNDFQDTRTKLLELNSKIQNLEKNRTELSLESANLIIEVRQMKAAEEASRKLEEIEKRIRDKKILMQNLSNLLPNSKFSKNTDIFLNNFKTLLQDNPEDSAIKAKIQEGLLIFNNNIQIRTSLCQMTLALSNPTHDPLEPKQRNLLISKIAINILDSLKRKNNDVSMYYTNEINKLYNNIGIMQDNTPKKNLLIHTLLDNLRSDLDSFISLHQDKNPGQFKDLYNAFKPIFYARLHSQDVALSKHKSWKSFAINLLIGFMTLGIALGIKAVHSRYTTGQVTLFARKTDEQKNIESMDQSLDDLGRQLLKK